MGVSNLQSNTCKIIVYAMNIHEIFALEDDKWFDGNISIRTKEKIKRLKFIDDKKRTLCGEMLVRYVMVREKQFSNDSIVFDVGENGKPYCINYPQIHFNISHSGSWVICVVSDVPVGVDIERIGAADMQIAKRFFSEYEYQYIIQQENKAEIFYKLWTLKESYIKCTGEGLAVPLNSFEFEFTNENIQLKTSRTNKFCFISEKVFVNYYLSLCCEKQYKAMIIEQIKIKEIKKYM